VNGTPPSISATGAAMASADEPSAEQKRLYKGVYWCAPPAPRAFAARKLARGVARGARPAGRPSALSGPTEQKRAQKKHAQKRIVKPLSPPLSPFISPLFSCAAGCPACASGWCSTRRAARTTTWAPLTSPRTTQPRRRGT
jgi:hypothetical protein